MDTWRFDLVCIGGGIAGVWLHTLAKQLGYQSLLLSNEAIGSGQTIHAQGIIHGGIKYTLHGHTSKSASNIQMMPERWRNCLIGKPHEGEHGNTNLDLRGVELLSKHHYLWTTKSWHSKVSALVARSMLSTSATHYDPPPYPFSAQENSLYQLDEFVIDVPSLLLRLFDAHSMRHATVRASNITQNADGTLDISLDAARIQTNALVFSAGSGNQSLLNSNLCAQPLATQNRPLHMLAMADDNLPDMFAHAVEIDSVPRLTITTHKNQSGQSIWYIGGKIAEQGINTSHAELVEIAQREIATLLPAFRFNKPCWRSLKINRAEVKQTHFTRPDGASFEEIGHNLAAVWPTKLTCTPQLGDLFSQWLNARIHSKVQPVNYKNLPLPQQTIAHSFYHDLESQKQQ